MIEEKCWLSIEQFMILMILFKVQKAIHWFIDSLKFNGSQWINQDFIEYKLLFVSDQLNQLIWTSNAQILPKSRLNFIQIQQFSCRIFPSNQKSHESRNVEKSGRKIVGKAHWFYSKISEFSFSLKTATSIKML